MDNIFKKIDKDNIVAAYNYGSVVYGTNTEKSDVDIILVVHAVTPEVSNLINEHKNSKSDKLNIDIQAYTKEEFIQKIHEHEISILECLFLPEKDKLIENIKWDFHLKLPLLRKSISEKASNSWVKAKKKLIVEKDYNPYIGLKSAWHSLRILNFGIQIATYGKIVNYAVTNELFQPILSCKSWEELNSKYKAVFNETSSRFKAVAPKEVNSSIKLKK